EALLRPAPARRGLRLPPDAPLGAGQGGAHPLLRRHLRGAHEEGAGPRPPARPGAVPPLPPLLRQEPVLQLPPRGPHARGPGPPVAGPGGEEGAPAAAHGHGHGKRRHRDTESGMISFSVSLWLCGVVAVVAVAVA